jgi:photosystem II stability/assembly factor-like uncharacterized protein
MIGARHLLRLIAGATAVPAAVGALVLTGGAALPAAAVARASVAPRTAAAAAQPGATAPWATTADPYTTATTVRQIATFGTTGVVVVGNGGTIAVSTNGGATWTRRALPGGASQAVQAVAFSDASHGWAVGATGQIDFTTNGGATWQAAPQSGTFTAVAAATTAQLVCALGASSLLTATGVATPTWTPEATTLTLPAAPASIVAGPDGPDGFAAASGAGGSLITRGADGSWTAQASLGESVVLALAPAPVWGTGTPQLFAVGAGDVQGSGDAGASFQPLPVLPAATPGLSSAAYLDPPEPQLLVGGKSGLLARYVLTTGAWSVDSAPLTGTIVSCAAGPGGVAYALSSSGHVERTLSYGAAPLALKVSATTVSGSAAAVLTASSSIRAPGTLSLDERRAGGVWRAIYTWPWSTDSTTAGQVDHAPPATSQYRLLFVYAGQSAATSAAVTVRVRPIITVTSTSLRVRKGVAYRLRGHVSPTERGREVTIWTNRGGGWHRVSNGSVFALASGSSFATRQFGTPLRESYELQVRLAASGAYLAANSALVRVTVR